MSLYDIRSEKTKWWRFVTTIDASFVGLGFWISPYVEVHAENEIDSLGLKLNN